MGELEVSSVTKRFGLTEVRKGLNLKTKSGQFCALLGPSGCGTSTSLRMTAGIEAVNEGDIPISGANVTNVTPAKRCIAMVYQPLERGSGAPCC